MRPKAEFYEENLLIVTRLVESASGGLNVQQVSLFVGSDFVLTFRENYGEALEPVRQRLRYPKSRVRTSSSDYLGYAILDTIIDAYYPVMEDMAERLESVEEWVLEEASSETPRKLNDLKGELLTLRRAIAPQRESLQALLRGDEELVSDTVRVYLRDTFDHVVQIAEAVEQGREFVSGLMNTYLTVVSNRMNEVMKTLTIVASIFIPLTFLAGIYGMNFEHMPELGVEVGLSGSAGSHGCGDRWDDPLFLAQRMVRSQMSRQGGIESQVPALRHGYLFHRPSSRRGEPLALRVGEL